MNPEPEFTPMRAVAKVNLYLKVLRRREDGFHELRTLFVPLSEPADEVTCRWTGEPGIRVSSDQPELPRDLDNLAGQAAARYAALAGLEPTWNFHIVKRIPMTAGLGGGSSDAAAALRLLQERYRALPAAQLAALALELGSDVPFFLAPRPAWAEGRGERLTPLDLELPPLSLLLINPRFPVRAGWAYARLAEARKSDDPAGPERLLAALRTRDPDAIGGALHNDLGFALYDKFPILRLLRDFLRSHGAAGVEISGSGPTLFALCRSPEHRTQLRSELADNFPVDLFDAEL